MHQQLKTKKVLDSQTKFRISPNNEEGGRTSRRVLGKEGNGGGGLPESLIVHSIW